MKEWFIAMGIGLFVFIGISALSWVITCGAVWVVTKCFGWTFSWPVATGVWIIFLAAKSIFSHHTTVKK